MSIQTETLLTLGEGIHYATPVIPSSTATESEIVRSVLQMLQGLSLSAGSLFLWDANSRSFRVSQPGVYLTHLSRSSLHNLLHQFVYAASCLQLVEIFLDKLRAQGSKLPTLSAFVNSACCWLKRLRDVALEEEMKVCNSSVEVTPTLLGLSSSLSSLCSGAEYLMQTVYGAVPRECLEQGSSISAAQVAVHILDYLYKKMDKVCLVEGGEEEAYRMVLHMLVACLLPYIESLDSWLFEGILDDPCEEMFFYANGVISIDDSGFWEKSYQLRQEQYQKLDVDNSTLSSSVLTMKGKKELGNKDSSSVKGKEDTKRLHVCPLFISDMAKAIVSAGKSLQLIRHVPASVSYSSISTKSNRSEIDGLISCEAYHNLTRQQKSIAGLTLSEIFCVSVTGLVGHGDHVYKYLLDDISQSSIASTSVVDAINKDIHNRSNGISTRSVCSEKVWYKFMLDALQQKKVTDLNLSDLDVMEKYNTPGNVGGSQLPTSFCPENPVLTVCQGSLENHKEYWNTLNLSRKFCLPPLNDEALREAVFGGNTEPFPNFRGTNYAMGFRHSESEYARSVNERAVLEDLFPFPTILPSVQDDGPISDHLPFQKNSTLPSRVLRWIQEVEPRSNTHPIVIMQECLYVYIKKQVDSVGRMVLSKLMNEWRLMDELAILRAIYLLGSGDLLQHFSTIIFDKLDKGETWDDEFELNTILQESFRNSADGSLLNSPDSLVVTITRTHGLDGDERPSTPSGTSTRKTHPHNFGLDALASLNFTYKVSWPLELIANAEAIKKYNQVMTFLLKVKRVKFVLDKVRKWMWKSKGRVRNSSKRHWLVEQKLLHFIDAFHQHVMDGVYHSAWRELCEGMTVAGSLDEVMEVHEAYLLSIQRQCFVVPGKLWSVIANRINRILNLALDFYAIQQTLNSDEAASPMKAKCETTVEQIEKSFNDCIAVLLRVLSVKVNVKHFPHLADLVARINYNYFYVSDNGTLRTNTSSGTATSRIGKVFIT
ncbi:Gamma-tubulin complex component 5 (Fragment) [Linum perenne]